MPFSQDIEARLWPKVDPDGPVPSYRPELGSCWLWLAYIGKHGYGLFRLGGAMRLAHRVVYESVVGPIPGGLELDHLCRVRHCVRPGHLEPVTRSENQMRSPLRGSAGGLANSRKTHCPKGHPYDVVERRANGRQARRCSTCRNALQREREQRRGGR